MKLVVTPLTITAALAFVERHHSHHHAPPGGLFAVGVSACAHERECPAEDACALTLRCAALVSRPVARKLDQLGHVAEVTRVASDRTRHASSKCIAAASRMALAGGYTRLVSYTLLGESGASYLAAGWHVTGLTNNECGWDTRPGRSSDRQTGCKVRWEFGPGALPADGAAALVCAFAVGAVKLRPRKERRRARYAQLSLFGAVEVSS